MMQNAGICVIFAGGPEQGLPCRPVPEDAFVICADSGLRLCERLHLTPDLVLGDFDSLGAVPAALPHITAPAEKDDTDTMLAVRTALEKGFRELCIFGAFGGRLDHTLANLQALEFLREHGASGMLIGAGDWAVMLLPGETGRFRKREDETFSVFAWSETCSGVCIRGTKYPLEGAELRRSFPLGVSNEITAEHAEVCCGAGILLVIGSRQELSCRNTV
ncbi:MAG: thiamine diphosphokinase [Oscillospiraceae bacterium]|nr:thiamine diphosphokinase [Oscillospiraceae bacterium]